jgi:hypothetical protein
MVKSLTINKPHSAQCNNFILALEIICFLPKLFLQLILSLLFTMIFSVAIMFIVSVIFVGASLFGPLALFALAC